MESPFLDDPATALYDALMSLHRAGVRPGSAQVPDELVINLRDIYTPDEALLALDDCIERLPPSALNCVFLLVPQVICTGPAHVTLRHLVQFAVSRPTTARRALNAIMASGRMQLMVQSIFLPELLDGEEFSTADESLLELGRLEGELRDFLMMAAFSPESYYHAVLARLPLELSDVEYDLFVTLATNWQGTLRDLVMTTRALAQDPDARATDEDPA